MGKSKGAKGFMSKMQGKGGPKGEEAEESSGGEEGEKQQIKQPSVPAAPAAAAPIGGAGAGGDEDSDGEGGQETRAKMVKRHAAEMTAHKKAVARSGKKSKDELTKINKVIEDRHAAELGAPPKAAKAAAPADIGAAIAGMSIGSSFYAGGEGGGDGADGAKSKAAKRRERMEREEAEREARIREETAAMGPSSRVVEEAALLALLTPLGLTMRTIQADGHCLYRSVADQLTQAGRVPAPGYQELREQAAAYMRSHPDDFVPFVYDSDRPGAPDEQLAAHCDEVAGTAAWGGQPEIVALAEVLKAHVEVHAVGMPVVKVGEAYAGGGAPLTLCYLRHAFGLGEHYNSVEPLVAADAEAAAEPAAEA
ncbi:hypothetical protein FOA52_015219 [Chlamydomonas sp. UWO 241]|nr:hypothetical protein FOA52_015219 [Chlamydomonas sp. UWO 241]